MNKTEFLRTRDREFQTTIKVLKAYPENKQELKPSEKSSSAKQLAFTFVMEEILLQKLLRGEPLTGAPPAEIPSISQSIKEYEDAFHQTNALIKSMSDEELAQTTKFYVAPKTLGDVRKIDLAWMLLFDSIHHRGQFSVYLRVAGARVPSIYGPTADEQWT